jgi:hypothetical protein
MSTLQAALALAAKGCLVFPIQRGGKKPAIRSWPDLATTDPDRIGTWWRRWPDANVGIHTRGLLVLDIDGPDGQESLLRLRETRPLPPTLRILSGNRDEPHHYQILYRLSPGLRARNKPLCCYPGYTEFGSIDIRSTRGQVVGPGSVHPTGGLYRWESEPRNVYEQATEAPEWAVRVFCVVEEARGRAGGPEAHGARRKGLPEPGGDDELLLVLRQRFPIAAPGQRQARMTGAVGWLASKRLAPDRILRLATCWLGSYRETFTTPYRQGLKELHALVYRTQKNLCRGSFLLPPDHDLLSAKQDLLPELSSWLEAFICCPGGQQRASNVRCSRLLSVPEGRFVEVLLLHYQYRRGKEEEGQLLMTDRELMAIHEKRFGQKLTWNRLGEMKGRFFTRQGKTGELRRASLRELVVL